MISEERQARDAEVGNRMKNLRADAKVMKEKGYSNVEIADRLGVSESSVRTLLHGV